MGFRIQGRCFVFACMMGLSLFSTASRLQAADGDKKSVDALKKEMRAHLLSPADALQLFAVAAAQKELKLNAEQMEKIQKQRQDIEHLDRKSSDYQAKNAAALLGVEKGLKPDQIERANQLYLQCNEYSCLIAPALQKILGFSKEESKKILQTEIQANEEIVQIIQKQPTLPREELVQKKRAIVRDSMKKILEMLTPEQKETFKKLKGKKFEVDISADYGSIIESML